MAYNLFYSFIIVLFSLPIYAQQNIFASLLHDGMQREYIVHLPPRFNLDVSLPLVIVLHGGSGTAQNVQGFTQMNPVSNRNDFVVAYPQGIGQALPGFSWADGRGTTADAANIDDVGFISELIDQLALDYNINLNQVYVCGFSNGGFMTQRLACELTDKFAAIGGLGCSMDTQLIQACEPSKPIPMMYIAGTSDPEVPFNGGAMRNPNVLPIVAVDSAIQFWVEQNNCITSNPIFDFPDRVLSDNSTAQLFVFSDCDCNATVRYYKIINGGHTWPGIPLPQLPQLGNTNEDIEASVELWDFFKDFKICNEVTSTMNEIPTIELQVFPNPSTDWIQIDSELEIVSLILFDLEGRKVAQSQEKTINIQHLGSGVYTLKVELPHYQFTSRRIIKY